MPPVPHSPLRSYGVAGLATAAALAARFALDPLLGDRQPFCTFYLAVAVTAWFGGLRPALAAVALGGLAGHWFFVPPRGAIALTAEGDLAGLLTFAAVGAALGGLTAALRTARAEAARRAAELQAVMDSSSAGNAALRESEERFARFMQHLPGLGWIKDKAGRYVYVNDAAERAFGRPRAELYGKTDSELFPPDTAARFRENDRLALADRGGVQAVETLTHPDGTVHHSLVSKFPIPGPGGEEVLIGGVAFDVTDRRRAEEALRESEVRYRTLFESIDEGFCVCEVLLDEAGTPHDYRFLETNPVFESMTGLGRAVGRTARELVPDLEEFWFETYGRVALTGEPVRFEHRAEAMNRWFDVYASRVGDPGERKIAIVFTNVTARKRAEEVLRQSEERLRGIFDQTLAGIAETDLAGRFVQVNRRYCEIVDRAAGELYGLRMQDLTHPDDRPHSVRLFEQAVAHGTPFTVETRYVRPDGSLVWVSNSVSVVRDAHGRPGHVVAACLDVTERKRAEEALRESEARFRNFADTAPAMLWVSGPDAACSFLSRGWYEFTGQTEAEALGFGWLDAVHPDDRAASRDALLAANAHREPFAVEHRLRRADGEYRWVIDAGRPRFGPGGGFLGYTGSVIDIHDRKLTEEILRVSRERLDLVVNSSQVGLWYCDLPFDRLNWNARVKEHFGLPPDHAVTIDTFYERLHPDDRDRTRTAIEAAINDRTDYDIEYRTVGLDGRERWVRAIGRAAYDGTGTPTRFDGITLDVTERVRQQEALKEADRRKDEFLATLAHELRNPLAPIRNALQVFHLKELSDPYLRAARDVIDRQVRTMVRLIDDLLDISRITRGKLQLRRQRVELAAVVQAAQETAAPTIEAAGLDLAVELPSGPVWLDADPTRLAQVVANLLTNAAKYTDRGGRIRLTASIVDCGTRNAESDSQSASRSPHPAMVEVAVADTGIGIPAEHLPRLFQMFSQVAPARERSQGGLGIGLALVRGLVEMHGGTVRAESPGVGRGSTFVVRLPVVEDKGGRTKGEQPAESEAAPAHPSAVRLPPSKVLVIDDSRDGADSLAEILRVLGYEVRVAYDGPAGLAEADGFRPDAVVCDIGMPGMSGLEVARRLRADPALRAARLVAVTGWGQDSDRRLSREAGFDRHLTKPVDPVELHHVLAAGPGGL